MVVTKNCHVDYAYDNVGLCAPTGGNLCIPHALKAKSYRVNMHDLGIATIPNDLLICVDEEKSEVTVFAGNQKENKFKKIGSIHIPDVVILKDIYEENTKEAK